jgi:hypothetical protein
MHPASLPACVDARHHDAVTEPACADACRLDALTEPLSCTPATTDAATVAAAGSSLLARLSPRFRASFFSDQFQPFRSTRICTRFATTNKLNNMFYIFVAACTS